MLLDFICFRDFCPLMPSLYLFLTVRHRVFSNHPHKTFITLSDKISINLITAAVIQMFIKVFLCLSPYSFVLIYYEVIIFHLLVIPFTLMSTSYVYCDA